MPSRCLGTEPEGFGAAEELPVERPRLITRLDAPATITRLSAPAGFGKTTLVSQWLERSGAHAIWFTAGSESARPGAFWEGLLDAVVTAGAEQQAHSAARSERGRVRHAIAGLPAGSVLVLDRFELVEDAAVEDQILELTRANRELRVIVCTRDHRRFSRYAGLAGALDQITAHDLLFTAEEVGRMIEVLGANASPQRIAIVLEHTAGWPGPARALAGALWLDPRAQVVRRSETAAAAQVVSSWLAAALFPDRGGPQSLEFASAVSIAEELSSEMAQDLVRDLGDLSIQDMLELLERQGVLVAGLDGGEVVYRWPPALRTALTAHLRGSSGAQTRAPRAVVARWYLARDRPEVALEHAVAGEEWRLVVVILEQHWRRLLMVHRDSLFAALNQTPLEAMASSPRALAVRDLRMQMPDDKILTAVPALPTDPVMLRRIGESDDALETLDTALAMLLVLRRRGLLERAARLSEQVERIADGAWRVRTSELAPSLPGLMGQIGATRVLAGDLAGARRPLRWAFEHASEAALDYVGRETAGKLALVCVLEGDIEQAEVWLDRHERSPAVAGWAQEATGSAAVTTRILLAVDRLELEDALVASRGRAAPLGTDEMWGFTAYAAARVALHRGAFDEGLMQIAVARGEYEQWHSQGSAARALLAAAEVELLLALGRLEDAEAALERPHGEHWLLRVPRARLALIRNEPQVVFQILRDVERRGSRRELLDLRVLEALGRHRLGQYEAAAAAAELALAAARPARQLRPFASVPSPELTAIAELLAPGAGDLLGAERLAEAACLLPERPGSKPRRVRSTREGPLWDAFGQLMAGDLSAAANAFGAFLEQPWERSGEQSALAAGGAALALAMAGDVRAASLRLRNVAPTRDPRTRLEVAGTVACRTAELLVAVARLDREAADRALDAVRKVPPLQLQYLATFAVAEHGLTFSRPLEVLHEVEGLLALSRDHRPRGAGALLTRAVSAELMLAAGLGNRARALLHRRERAHPLLAVATARLELLAGRVEQAMARATQALWQPVMFPRARAHLLLILAAAEGRLGRDQDSRAHLAQASATLARHDLLSPLVSAPRELRDRAVIEAAAVVPTNRIRAWPELYPAELDLVELTRREREVLQGLAEGLDAAAMAQRSVVSVTTVRSQIQSVYRKLRVHSRHDAVARATRWGLLEPPDHRS